MYWQDYETPTPILFFLPGWNLMDYSSNRNNSGTRETNLFIADWVD